MPYVNIAVNHTHYVNLDTVVPLSVVDWFVMIVLVIQNLLNLFVYIVLLQTSGIGIVVLNMISTNHMLMGVVLVMNAKIKIFDDYYKLLIL